MPLSLGPEEAGAYLESFQAPGPHLDMLTAVGFRAAGAAARLGVFDALDEPMPITSLAEKLGVDERALTLLTDLLVTFNYLTRSPQGYANSELTRRWLRPGTPGSYLSTLVLWQKLLFELWEPLEQTIRTGQPAVDFYSWLEKRPDMLHEFHTMLAGFAAWNTEDILSLVPLPAAATRLLDLGGGHAQHTIAFCQRYPQVQATIVDLPGALDVGRRAAASAGVADRVSFQDGDWSSTSLGNEYDLVLMFNVVHGNAPEANDALLRNVFQAMRPGGTVAVLEQLARDETPAAVTEEAFVSVFSLNLLHTQGGRLYSRDAIAAWLAGAGFEAPQWHRLPKMPADHLAVATKLR